MSLVLKGGEEARMAPGDQQSVTASTGERAISRLLPPQLTSSLLEPHDE